MRNPVLNPISKQLLVFAGSSLDEAIEAALLEKPCWFNFNGVKITVKKYSTVASLTNYFWKNLKM